MKQLKISEKIFLDFIILLSIEMVEITLIKCLPYNNVLDCPILTRGSWNKGTFDTNCILFIYFNSNYRNIIDDFKIIYLYNHQTYHVTQSKCQYSDAIGGFFVLCCM